MEATIEFSGVEDAFQAGKRLFAEGKVDKAHEKLVLACVRAPQMDLYRLHEQFVGSRMTGKFADADETRSLASKLARDESTAAFASYVLGYVALESNDSTAATRHFDNAFRLDRTMLDAGRQLRKLALGGTAIATPPASFQVPSPRSSPRPPRPRSANHRAFVLLGVLAVVTTSTIGYVAATRAGMFSDYVEVR